MPAFLASPVAAKLLALLIPVIVSLLAVPALQLLKRASARVDAAPPALKAVLAVVVSAALTGLTHLLGIPLPDTLASIGKPEVQALLGAAFAMLLHQSGYRGGVVTTAPEPSPDPAVGAVAPYADGEPTIYELDASGKPRL